MDRATADRRRATFGARSGLLALGLSFALVGCSDLLDVENPNSIKQADLEQPVASEAIANGALALTTKAINAVMGPYATLGDEVMWIGSRDAWNQIDQGDPTDPNNEFTDSAFPALAQARWFADEAIKLLEGHRDDGNLADEILLARVYMYSAIMYMTAADMFDDFALSDRTVAAEPIGPTNMYQLYDMAIQKLNAGRTIALAEGNSALATTMLALRARAHHSKAVWQMLHPYSPGDGLVNNADASADAAAVIGDLGGVTVDWRFQLTNNNQVSAVERTGEVSLAYNLHSRGELQYGPSYVTLSADLKDVTGISLNDLITGDTDPVLDATIDEFIDGFLYSAYTVASSREMHLILAEAALAAGNEPDAATHINHVRAMDELPAFDPDDAGHPATLDMLKHARRVNLFFQGRRVADMYRFGDPSPEWLPASRAATTPGTFFPVTGIELRSNCLFPNNFC